MSESIEANLPLEQRLRMAGRLLAIAAIRVAASQEKDTIDTDDYENEYGSNAAKKCRSQGKAA